MKESTRRVAGASPDGGVEQSTALTDCYVSRPLTHEIQRRIEKGIYDRFEVIEETVLRILESGDL